MAQGRVLEYPADQLQDYDYLLDLTPKERDSLNEWVDFFGNKYETVGTLLHTYLPEAYSEDDSGMPKGGGFLDDTVRFEDKLNFERRKYKP